MFNKLHIKAELTLAMTKYAQFKLSQPKSTNYYIIRLQIFQLNVY